MDTLSEEDAIAMVLKQQSVQDKIESRNIRDAKYTLYKGLEGVVNIITESRIDIKKVVGEQ